MIKLCEACYRQIAEDEPYTELRSLYKVSASGRPQWRSLYLHRFDPAADNCLVPVRSAAAPEGQAG